MPTHRELQKSSTTPSIDEMAKLTEQVGLSITSCRNDIARLLEDLSSRSPHHSLLQSIADRLAAAMTVLEVEMKALSIDRPTVQGATSGIRRSLVRLGVALALVGNFAQASGYSVRDLVSAAEHSRVSAQESLVELELCVVLLPSESTDKAERYLELVGQALILTDALIREAGSNSGPPSVSADLIHSFDARYREPRPSYARAELVEALNVLKALEVGLGLRSPGLQVRERIDTSLSPTNTSVKLRQLHEVLSAIAVDVGRLLS